MVNVLVIGSGGREHALSWKLSQSSKVETVYTAPGNGGTKNNIPLDVNDLDALAEFAQKNNCFTVVGPEDPLAAGIVDKFNKLNLKVFGPSQAAAQLESSKIWAKNFMKRNNIPTARFEIFDDPQKAEEYVKSIDYDVVVKADGLAAGKGVIVCNSNDEAISAIHTILVKKTFGDAGNKIIIEERIDGIEASYIALSDGDVALPMASSQDHKRIFDDDEGPNTGGMGAYSPTPIVTTDLAKKIQEEVIEKLEEEPWFGLEQEYFIEDNNLPFDHLLKQAVLEFTNDGTDYPIVESQSIYYNNREDFKAYLTFRCINKRTTLNKPNLEHMCSDTFCFENWKEKN